MTPNCAPPACPKKTTRLAVEVLGSQVALSVQMGVSVRTVYNWMHGRTEPRQAELEKMKRIKEGV